MCWHTFKASLEEVIVLPSEKIKAKCMKEDMWKSFFHKLAGWYLATSLQINFFTYNFQQFYVNKRLQMATFPFHIKCLKSTCEIFLYCISWLKFCSLYMKKAVSQRWSIKQVLLKASQNSQINIRSSHPEVFCQKMFLKVSQNSQKYIFPGVCFLIKLQLETWNCQK